MREKHVYCSKRTVCVIASVAIAILMAGLFGCSNETPSQGSQNGVIATAPDTPENTTYNLTLNRNTLVLGGVNGNGVPDNNSNCQLNVTLKDEGNIPLVDATIELRWTTGDYPHQIVCFAPSGVTWSVTSGGTIHHLYATTDAYGVARFRAAGYYDGSIACSGGEGTYRDGRLFVDGVEQTAPTGGWFNVATADLNDASGVTTADEDLCEDDIFCGSYYFSRSDYNGDGVTNSADLSILANIKNGGGSIASCNE